MLRHIPQYDQLDEMSTQGATICEALKTRNPSKYGPHFVWHRTWIQYPAAVCLRYGRQLATQKEPQGISSIVVEFVTFLDMGRLASDEK